MYFGFLVLLATATAVFADSLSKTSQVHATTTITPGFHSLSTCTTHFIESTPTSFPSPFMTAFTECDNVIVNSTPLHDGDTKRNERVIIVLITINIFLQFTALVLIIWLGWAPYLRRWQKRYRLQKNPERRRAEHLLNDHPQPADLELGVIHAPTPPTPPDSASTDNTRVPAAGPNGCNQERKHVCPEISNLTVEAEGIDITDSPIRQRYMAETELLQPFQPITEDSETDADMSHAPQDTDSVGPLASATRKPAANRYHLFPQESPKMNGAVAKDRAHKNL
ncbi:hypothetical protein EKO27_g3569 [Xylaria grammica]|uniref:Uncharacterized protein n=1 Tax=Xylaria grammica TaxID=363999 RepID=A0A439DAZ0_9PEZI|nr:hypothetical protein EKO27_g3569 [Xylaria grammica]